MCGRFVAASPPDVIARYFGAEPAAETSLEPSYNVAPTSSVPAIVEHGEVRQLETLRWGLVPFWAKELKVGNRMINARAETVAERPAYRRAFRSRRCLIPADGFYEWEKLEHRRTKQPWYIHRADGEPFAFAGLWEVWRGPERDEPEIRSCTIITGPANEAMSRIHDRMPVVLPPSTWSTWLDRDNDDVASLSALLVPAPSELLTMHPVSTRVNNPRTEGADLVEPVTPPESPA